MTCISEVHTNWHSKDHHAIGYKPLWCCWYRVFYIFVFLAACLLQEVTMQKGTDLPCRPYEVRISASDKRNCTIEGRIEICENSTWKTVCDSDWTQRDATVVCRQLGHQENGALNINVPGATFTESTTDGIGIIASVPDCDGSEKNISECNSVRGSQTQDQINRLVCVGVNIAYVKCYKMSNATQECLIPTTQPSTTFKVTPHVQSTTAVPIVTTPSSSTQPPPTVPIVTTPSSSTQPPPTVPIVTTPSSPTPPPPTTSSELNFPAIIGGAVVGVLVIAIMIVTMVIFVLRWKHLNKQELDHIYDNPDEIKETHLGPPLPPRPVTSTEPNPAYQSHFDSDRDAGYDYVVPQLDQDQSISPGTSTNPAYHSRQ